MKRLITFVLLMTGLSSFGYAQADTISIVGFGSSWPDSTFLDSSVTLNVTIRNENTVNTLTGNISLIFARDTAGPVINTDTVGINVISLPPGDTTSYPMSFSFRSAAYPPGNNVVVIWPVNGDGIGFPLNGLSRNIWLKQVVGIGEDQILTGISYFPNPAQEHIRFEHLPEGRNTLRIYTSEGRLVQSEVLTTSATDISMLPTGIYHLVIENDQKYWSEPLVIKR